MLNSVSGSVMFLLVMFFLFQSIFTFATPLMDGVENLIGLTATFVTDLTGPGMLADFLNDAIFGGLGSFLVFVPQIMVLTLIIGLLVRPAAAVLAIAMLVAIFSVHIGNGLFMSKNGYEFGLALLAASVSLLLSGAGRASIDAVLSQGASSQAAGAKTLLPN